MTEAQHAAYRFWRAFKDHFFRADEDANVATPDRAVADGWRFTCVRGDDARIRAIPFVGSAGVW